MTIGQSRRGEGIDFDEAGSVRFISPATRQQRIDLGPHVNSTLLQLIIVGGRCEGRYR